MTTVDTIIPWARWTSALISTLYPNGMGEGTQFSIGSTSTYVDLVDANPDVTNYGVYQIGDAIPAASPNYSVLSSGLALTYDLFLDHIDLKGDIDPNLKGLLNGAASDANEAQGAYKAALTEAAKEYNLITKGEKNPPSLTEWAAMNYPGLKAAKETLQSATAHYDQLLTKAYGAGAEVLLQAKNMAGPNGGALDQASTKYNMVAASGSIAPAGSKKTLPGGTSATKEPGNLKTFQAPSYSIDQSLAANYPTWQSNSVNNIVDQTIDYSSGKADTSFKEAGWHAEAKTSWSFFVDVTATASGQQKTINIDASASEFSMSVSFAGFGKYAVTPGIWWQNGSMVSNFKDQLIKDSPDYFAEDGPLARRATAVVLGFVPTVKLKMSAADYSRLKTAWSTSASLSVGIGPFSFSGSGGGGGGKDVMHFSDADSSVTMGPVKSTMPVLLGVESQEL